MLLDPALGHSSDLVELSATPVIDKGQTMALRITRVTVDCANLQVMETFWAEALGYVRSTGSSSGTGGVEDPDDRDVELVFVQVPEGKTVKNRVHLDLGADSRDAEVERLVGLGARKLRAIDNWTVMSDPEGNEFCVVQAPDDDPVEGWRSR